MDLSGARVLVTGGAGLIGSHLADLLLERGCRVRIFDNLEPQTHPKGRPDWIPSEVEFVQGDIRHADDVRSALTGMDYVFHQAAFGGFTTEITKYVEVNTVGTVRLFETIRTHKLPVKKIVLASSQAVYGEGTYRCPQHKVQYPKPRQLEQFLQKRWELECLQCQQPMVPLPTKEEKRKDGSTIYALTKGSEEWLLRLGKSIEVPVVALRYAVTFGPRQSVYNPYTGVVSIFSTRLLNGRPPIVYEDGAQSRDFIYVEDVARANIFVMERQDTDYDVFNVGTEKPTTVLELVNELKNLYGLRQIEPKISGSFRPGDARHFIHDSSKLRALGWEPTVSVREGLRRYHDWIETKHHLEDYFQEAENLLRQMNVVIEPAN